VAGRLVYNISSDEYERSARFHFQRDRHRWIVARATLRQILSGYLECKPRDVSFSYGAFGKPALAGSVADRELRFNLAHSGGYALFAVTYGRNIGVDLELVRPLRDLTNLALSTFSAFEKAAWEALPEGERLRGFFDGWTRKEAYLKATGNGLTDALDAFDVSLEPGPGLRELNIRARLLNETRWMLVSLAPHSEYSAAVVVEGCDCHVTCAEFTADRLGKGELRGDSQEWALQ
jgi:4'-phosphopantetheinyl transferase